MWDQKETGIEGEHSEDIGPSILWGFGGLGHDPELALGMVNECHGMASGGTDRPATTQEIHLMIGIDASSEVQGQMEIQQAGVGARTQDLAFFFLSLGAKRRWGTGRWCGRRYDSDGPVRGRAVPGRGRHR